VTGTGNGNYTVTSQAGLTQTVTPSADGFGHHSSVTIYDGTTTAKLGGTGVPGAETAAVGTGGDASRNRNGDSVSIGERRRDLAARNVGTQNVTIHRSYHDGHGRRHSRYAANGSDTSYTAKALTVRHHGGVRVYDGHDGEAGRDGGVPSAEAAVPVARATASLTCCGLCFAGR